MRQKISFKVIYNRLNKLNKNGEALIQIRLYQKPEEKKVTDRKYISTGIYIKPSEWDNRRNIISRKHPNFVRLNNIISLQLKNLQDRELDLINKGLDVTLAMISDDKAKNFFEYFEKFLTEHNVSDARKILIKRVIKYLKQYNNRITFKSFNYSQIIEFDNFLKEKKNLSQNSIANQHKVVKSFLNHALKSEVIDRNPYIKFKIIKEKVVREFLTMEEINRIEDVDENYITEQMKELKDMFLFSCFTGLRFSDVQSLTKDMFNFIDNEVFLTYKQTKTNSTQSRIPLYLLFEGKPVKIIKSRLESDKKHVFGRFTNQDANRLLKVLQPIARISKSLTFHLSRHTFGTQLARLSNDPYLIKELMGHSDIKTSMIYIHLNNQAMSDKLKKVKW